MDYMKIAKRLVCTTLASAVFLGLSFSASAADVLKPGTGKVELMMQPLSRSLTVALDGWREVKNTPGQPTKERVGGWSTLVDAAGGDVYHKTTAQYETFTGKPIGSQSVWGYGKVYAYSDYVLYYGVADSSYARVYYDY